MRRLLTILCFAVLGPILAGQSMPTPPPSSPTAGTPAVMEAPEIRPDAGALMVKGEWKKDAKTQQELTAFSKNPVKNWPQAILYWLSPAALLGTIQKNADNLLLIFQLLSIFLLVGGLVGKLRKESDPNTQMEHIATSVLLVAFISIIPWMRDRMVLTGYQLADSTGYAWVSYDDAGVPHWGSTKNNDSLGGDYGVISRMCDLSSFWAPPSMPAAEEMKTAATFSKSWAWVHAIPGFDTLKGAVTTINSTAMGTGEWLSGGFSKLTTMLAAGFMKVLSGALFVLMALMFPISAGAHMIQLTCVYLGFGILPVFIAGLGTESFKSQGQHFCFGLLGLIFVPLGWALANVPLVIMLQQLVQMVTVMHAAVAAKAAAGALMGVGIIPAFAGIFSSSLTLAIALVVGGTILVMLYMVISLILAPKITMNCVMSGAQFAGGLIGAHLSAVAAVGAAVTGAAAVVATGGAAAPVAGGAAAGAGGAGAGLAGGAAKAGASGAGALGGAFHKLGGMMGGRMGSAANRIGDSLEGVANRMRGFANSRSGGGSSSEGESAESSGSGGYRGRSGSSNGGGAPWVASPSQNSRGGGDVEEAPATPSMGSSMAAGGLMFASRVLSMASRLNPDRGIDAGGYVGEGFASAFTPIGNRGGSGGGNSGGGSYQPQSRTRTIRTGRTLKGFDHSA